MVWDPNQPPPAVDPNQQLNQDPTQGQAPGSQPPPQQPQQNQGQPSPSQAPPQDPLEPIAQGLAQRIRQYQQQQQAPANNGGAIKRMLGNFFQGAGAALTHEAGLPTAEDKYKSDLQELNTVRNTQSMIGLHQAMGQGMYGSQSIIDPTTGQPMIGADGTPLRINNKDLGHVVGQQMSAQARTQAAQTTATKPINVPGIGAFQYNPATKSYGPISGTQAPMITLQPGEQEALGLPPGTTQLPEDQYSKAVGARVKGLTTIQGATDQFQRNRITGVNTPIGVGNPRVAAAYAGANARAATTPFETVDDTGQPTTISNAQAIQSGASRISPTNLGQQFQKQALIDDIHGGINQLKGVSAVLDNPTERLKISAALASPGLTSQTLLQSPIIGSMSPAAQDYTIKMMSLREQAMAMRSVLGAGQGSLDLRDAVLKTVPGAATPGSKYANAQLDQFGTVLDRLGKGIVKPRGVAPPGSTPPPNGGPPQHLLGGSAQGLPEGTTGNGGKYIVRGGTWVTK